MRERLSVCASEQAVVEPGYQQNLGTPPEHDKVGISRVLFFENRSCMLLRSFYITASFSFECMMRPERGVVEVMRTPTFAMSCRYDYVLVTLTCRN